MNWEYIKNIGVIFSKDLLIFKFGEKRSVFRANLKYKKQSNSGRSPNEDSYENVLGTKDFLRLSFNNKDELEEIEILRGQVLFDKVAISINGNLSETLAILEKSCSCKFHVGDISYTDFENKFDLGDSYKNGAEKNSIAWFYTAPDLSHLKTKSA